MRRRISLAIFVVAFASIVTLGLPLAVIGIRFVESEARSRLDRELEALQLVFAPSLVAGQQPPQEELAAVSGDRQRQIELVDATGRKVVYGSLDEGPIFTVSASLGPVAHITLRRSGEGVQRRQQLVVAVVAGISIAGVTVALIIAAVIGRRLTRPLESLTVASARMGEGDFSARAPRSGVTEIDALADVLDHNAERIGSLVAAERDFAANASHQLRTPLTAMRLRLEGIAGAPDLTEAKEEASAALAQADRLDHTVDELLALARTGRVAPHGVVDVPALIRRAREGWAAALGLEGRRFELRAPGSLTALAASGGLHQALDILVDNARRHGGGTVTVEVVRRDDRVEVRVSDEGPGIPEGLEERIFERSFSTAPGGVGLGLHLARQLIQADDGRLELARARPPELVIYLHAAPTP